MLTSLICDSLLHQGRLQAHNLVTSDPILPYLAEQSVQCIMRIVPEVLRASDAQGICRHGCRGRQRQGPQPERKI